jgi:hypothetical protein
MMSSSLSLYANAANRNNPQNTNQLRESFSEQIINLNKAIRIEYIKLSEQQANSTPNPTHKPIKHTPKSPKKKSN